MCIEAEVFSLYLSALIDMPILTGKFGFTLKEDYFCSLLI